MYNFKINPFSNCLDNISGRVVYGVIFTLMMTIDPLFLKAEACFNRPTFFSVPCTFLFGEFDPVLMLTAIETDACLKGRKSRAGISQ